MTTNFDVRVLWKYAVGFVAGLVLFYLVQQLFFSKDKEPSGRDYQKENRVLQEEIDRLQLDSLKQRQQLQEEIQLSKEENLELRLTLRQLERHYEKLNFRAHTFDELDNIRDSVLSELRKE